MTQKTYMDYLETLAAEFLGHTPESKRFTPVVVDDILNPENPTGLQVQEFVLAAEYYTNSLSDNGTDNRRQNKTGGFMVCKHIDVKKPSFRLSTIEEAETLALEILEKVQENNETEGSFPAFDFDSIQIDPYGPMFANSWGVVVRFSFG